MNKHQHAILTNGRSGSNFLTNLLNSHPNIVNYGETLGNWTLPAKLYKALRIDAEINQQYLDTILSSRTFFSLSQIYSAIAHLRDGKKPNIKSWGKIQSIGIKDFSVQFQNRNMTDYFIKRPHIKVINLTRENQLKRFISVSLMVETGLVKATSEKTKNRNKSIITIDTTTLINTLEVYEKELNYQKYLAGKLPPERCLNLTYEKVFESSDSLLQTKLETLEFLNLDRTEISSSHRKLNSDQLTDLVENYDEVQKTLFNTSYEKYLDT